MVAVANKAHCLGQRYSTMTTIGAHPAKGEAIKLALSCALEAKPVMANNRMRIRVLTANRAVIGFLL